MKMLLKIQQLRNFKKMLLCWPIATFFKNVAINPLFSDARKKHRNIPLFVAYLKTSQNKRRLNMNFL